MTRHTENGLARASAAPPLYDSLTICSEQSLNTAPSHANVPGHECSCAASLNFVRWTGAARESLCQGLSSRWYTEPFHRNALVTHFQHGQVCCTTRRLENYAIARYRLHQRAPQRRHPADVVAVEIDLVGAHDAHHPLRSRGSGIAHSGSEECPRRRLPRSRSFRVNHFRGLDSFREKANPSIDLAQPPLAVLIVGVFTAIAVARSPRHHLRHGRAFPGEQKPVLVFEALQAGWRYVVLASRRRLVTLRFSRKPFSHILFFQRECAFWGVHLPHQLIVSLVPVCAYESLSPVRQWSSKH